MNVLSGLAIIKKRRAAVAGTVADEAFKVGTVGIVYTIASAIENRDAIKSSKLLRSAFTKLETAALSTMRKQKSMTTLNDQETGVLQKIAEIAKTSIGSVIEIGAKQLFSVLGRAMRLVVVPIFNIFVATVAATFRLITANPYTLAATALITAALMGRRMWLDRETDFRSGSAGPDLQPAPSASSSGGSAPTPIPTPTTPEGIKIQSIITDAARRNGVSESLALRVAGLESSMNPNAKSNRSSAKGLFGITDTTWKYMRGKPGAQFDPYANADIGTKYLYNNSVILKRGLGRDPQDYEMYAAHFFGPGVVAMLKNQEALADKPIEAGLALFASASKIKAILAANPHLKGKTVGQVIDLWRNKSGGSSTQVAATMRSNGLITPASGMFTSPFGARSFIGPKGLRVYSDHKGIDIANAAGTPIYAAEGGTVTISSVTSAGYGTLIEIDHGNGLRTRYGHSSKLFVRAGESVRKGQHIAAMGSAGFSTGPHLHFEVRTAANNSSGVPVDPASYLSGFPQAKNSMVQSGSQSAALPAETQYIRRDNKVVALKG